MSDAQLMHASKMARGESEYQGKLLEARQSDWKDEFVSSYINVCANVGARLGSLSDDPGAAMEKIKLFFEHVLAAPVMVHKSLDPCRGVIYGIKGTQIFRNGGGKK